MVRNPKSNRPFLKDSVHKVWDGALQNLGVIISGLILVGLAAAINRIKVIQELIRKIPTDYVLIPSVIALVFLIVSNRKLKKKMQNPIEVRFVSHWGVWWKLYPKEEYIEDFPYCSCCDPKRKLVFSGSSPGEALQGAGYMCPLTNTAQKILHPVWTNPRQAALNDLYDLYFRKMPTQFKSLFLRERKMIIDSDPEIDPKELTKKLFSMRPFDKIPEKAIEHIISKHSDSMAAFHFIQKNYAHYRRYMENLNKKAL